MAYDLKLAERIRAQLKGKRVIEKKMFGGVGYLINGNMVCGVHDERMIIRVDPAHHEKVSKKPHVEPFFVSHRPAIGWLMVAAAGLKTEKQLGAWVKTCLDFTRTLPPK